VQHRKIGIKWYWWVTALVLLVLIIAGYINRTAFL
jgi:Ni,Fe-hydrogenase I cytochrome b subunit